MRLAALFSGGKDSTYAIYLAKKAGHSVDCLVSVIPFADDSLLFHYPNSEMVSHLAEAMRLPLVRVVAQGRVLEEEASALDEAVSKAKLQYNIQGVVHGGLASNFQKNAFEGACKKHNLQQVAPLWGIDQEKYMHQLLESGFSVMIVGVSAMGLEQDWLGKTIDKESLGKLEGLSRKYGFNLAFEGGEAETLVLDCPLFLKKIRVRNARARWDGQRGMFEILEVELVSKDV